MLKENFYVVSVGLGKLSITSFCIAYIAMSVGIAV